MWLTLFTLIALFISVFLAGHFGPLVWERRKRRQEQSLTPEQKAYIRALKDQPR